MTTQTEWRWTDDRGVQRLVRIDELRAALASKLIPATTLVWRQGMSEWMPASMVPELAAAALVAGGSSVPGVTSSLDDASSITSVMAEALLGTLAPTNDPTAPQVSADAARKVRTLVGMSVPAELVAEGQQARARSAAPIVVPTANSSKDASKKGQDAPQSFGPGSFGSFAGGGGERAPITYRGPVGSGAGSAAVTTRDVAHPRPAAGAPAPQPPAPAAPAPSAPPATALKKDSERPTRGAPLPLGAIAGPRSTAPLQSPAAALKAAKAAEKSAASGHVPAAEAKPTTSPALARGAAAETKPTTSAAFGGAKDAGAATPGRSTSTPGGGTNAKFTPPPPFAGRSSAAQPNTALGAKLSAGHGPPPPAPAPLAASPKAAPVVDGPKAASAPFVDSPKAAPAPFVASPKAAPVEAATEAAPFGLAAPALQKPPEVSLALESGSRRFTLTADSKAAPTKPANAEAGETGRITPTKPFPSFSGQSGETDLSFDDPPDASAPKQGPSEGAPPQPLPGATQLAGAQSTAAHGAPTTQAPSPPEHPHGSEASASDVPTDAFFPPAGASPPLTGASPPLAGALTPLAGASPPLAGASPPLAGALTPLAGAPTPLAGALTAQAGPLTELAYPPPAVNVDHRAREPRAADPEPTRPPLPASAPYESAPVDPSGGFGSPSLRAGSESLREPIQVPFSSLLAVGASLIFMAVTSFVAGRCSVSPDRSPEAGKAAVQSLIQVVPYISRRAIPEPPKPCWVARQPTMWAARVSKSIPFEVSSPTPGLISVGYAKSENEAVGIEIDPATGDVAPRFTKGLEDSIDRVSPTAGHAFIVTTETQGGAIRPLVQVADASPPFVVGVGGSSVSIAPDPSASPSILWPLQGDGDAGAVRVQPVGDRGYAVIFRRGSAIWGGALGPDQKPAGPLTRVPGSDGSAGKPTSGFNGRELAVVFADRPKDSDHYEIRVGRSAPGSIPASTTVIPLPKGGPGGDAFAPGIAGLDDGRWVLIWTEGSQGNRAIRAQTLAPDLSPIGDPIALSPPAGNFGQGVAGVSGRYLGVVFLSQGKVSYELWGAMLQCG